MHATNPPLVLIFGPFDPSGSGSLPADAVTLAALGCHALSVLTAVQVHDTADIESIELLSPEIIDDQARCMLEDMTVQAFKVGPLYTTEAVSVLAQIAADYSHVPLVLQLSAAPTESLLEDTDAEDVHMAICELLLPQTDIVVADHMLLERMQSQGLLAGARGTNGSPAKALLNFGAAWVLSTGAPLRPGQQGYVLQGQQRETSNWPWTAPAARTADADGPLACAITTQLARGVPVVQAVDAAIALAGPLSRRVFQPGMGQRLINRCAS
ncbi:bifunctional hydroxymethylpyrimidine kinase/phosphomethylpyrimidine kinase [Pusillimonas sp. ANT_WB101]|uniref:bifunctional hydroxymethylpyrimidine kinase/phosphomethylpyrimidine kinase n=1 Tax=Pusillimonas sp. ANT_WB101 TaxID=2597356 RepID=UPI0011EED688|nr:bifunctional hydroxymethylpyrimidine kinase/phosphomethylpyrimidine kinase [Pusillimonas sp. ANT_WB101]KAA0889235.1 hydroxymethylpyrimidine/phosphomethylpyrimidine kinase [Pusillimonas sp. ANT_WB101]NYT78748.1 bifunctional hydroxymethylpyrimidine kinase/phosphomethylpyrimidine kinase [Alcaligenaceae bacterium]